MKKITGFQTPTPFWASLLLTSINKKGPKFSDTHPNAFTFRQISEENVTHVVSLDFSREIEHVEREIALEGAEDKRVELRLQVFIVIRLVVSCGASTEPVGTTTTTTTHSSSHVSVGSAWPALQGTVLRHAGLQGAVGFTVFLFNSCLTLVWFQMEHLLYVNE